MKCCILSCKNYSDKCSEVMAGITFHRFPSDENVRQEWISLINRQDWAPTQNTRICSSHFNENDIIVTKKGMKKLEKGALPLLNLDLSKKEKIPEDSTPSPQPSTRPLSDYFIFGDTPREKKLLQEIAQLKMKDKNNKLKVRALQMKVLRFKNKVGYLTKLVKELENKILTIAEES